MHPGGPFFARKDDGWWSIPKGEIAEGEEPLQAAIREFQEEIGLSPGEGPFVELGSVRQKGGKEVFAWAAAGDLPQGWKPCCNTFSIEWPPRSGRRQEFPEINAAQFFPLAIARRKMIEAQRPFLDRLCAVLDAGPANRGESK